MTNIYFREMPSDSSNITQAMVWNYHNWCTEYSTAIVIFSGISTVLFLLGFPASVWVLCGFFQRQRQRVTTDVFMLSLVVIDLIFTAQIPFNIFNFNVWHIMELQLILDIFFSLSLNGRPLFMACICLDCYVAVVYPIVYKTSKQLIVIRKAVTIIIYVIIAICQIIEGTMKWLYSTPFAAIPLFMALPIITFCDISILLALRNPIQGKQTTNIHPQKKQALDIVFNSFIMTFIVYLPPTIIFSFGHLMPLNESEIYCYLNCAGFSFCTAGCVIMPVLYLVRLGKLDIFKNWWKKRTSIC